MERGHRARHARRALRPGRPGPGQVRPGPEGSFSVTALDREAGTFTVVARLFAGLLTVTFFHEVTAIPAGTQITEHADFGGLLAPVLGLIERRGIRRRWPGAMRTLTSLARRDPPN